MSTSKRKNIKRLIISSVCILTLSCKEEIKDPNLLFTIETSAKNDKTTPNEGINFKLVNKENTNIDGDITYYLDGKKINGNNINFKNQKLGKKELKATFKFNDDLAIIKKNITVVAPNKPKRVNFEIINTYPHDIKAYTQGLEFHNGDLYESTGSYGLSSLRKVDYKTGNIEKKIDLDPKEFGEGLTILGDKLYQLTWRSKKGFVYDLNTFTKTKTFDYDKSIEGWGICNDGKTLYKSDGTEKIWTLDPNTLKESGYIEIYTNKSRIKSVNELEYINGKIFANIYQKNGIAIINPESGAVEGVIDCSSLRKKVTPHAKLDVLNGIAYNKETNTIFVTGKNWDKLFEIKITE